MHENKDREKREILEMQIETIEKKLTSGLQRTLPSYASHVEMMPTSVNKSAQSLNTVTGTTTSKKAAVLILLYQHGGEVRFPLIQRPVYNGVHSGQVALPGGKLEEQDDSLIATALREAEEEVGVDRKRVNVLGTLSMLHVAASQIEVLPVVASVRDVPLWKREVREVDEIITPSLSQLLASTSKKSKEMKLGKRGDYLVPYFELNEKVVWGATAMMLNELVAVLRSEDS